jgi:hypothetical protein
MQTLASVVEPFGVQDCVHFCGQRHFYRLAARPCDTESFCGFTTAEVACRKRNCLIQEEQLYPTAASHHFAVPSLKLTETGEPSFGRSASFQQGPSRRVMNDPAVAGEHASLRYRGDVTERRHPVLQHHSSGLTRRRHGARLGIERQQPVETEQLFEQSSRL